jgi:subtilisin family serine protease
MDPVTSSQFLILKDSFARKGVEIEAALTPTGELDYIYVVDRLLVIDRDNNIERLQAAMPGLRRADADEQPETGGLVRLSIDRVSIDDGEAGSLTVPEVLDLWDERQDNPGPAGEEPLVTPVHVVHISKITPAGEPEVPSGYPAQPWPAPPQTGGKGVKIGISDTGLQPNLNQYWWMTQVAGEAEPLGQVLPNGLRRIPRYAGHGTFAAGVAKCAAPEAAVYVNNHFTESEGEAEDVIIQKLNQLIQRESPDVVCLPAGLYTRNDWQSPPFNQLHQMHPNLTLVASAGNDSTDRKFYPAAFDWVVGVGALGTDQQHRAWFSNYGSWVDVYALGEGVVNAYAFGEYTYQEPPKAPAKQTFKGMARWAGTSFSAPLVAGLIAEEKARSGSSAAAAAQAVLNKAQTQMIPGVGPALYPPPYGPGQLP